MGADTKGFVMTEQKNAFEVAAKVVEAIEGLMKASDANWRMGAMVQIAMGESPSFTAPRVEMATFAEMLTVSFIFNGEDRMLRIHFDCDFDGEDCGYKDGSKLILSLGAWGGSVEIMEVVLDNLKHLGDTYIIENDCVDYELRKIN